MSYLSHVMLSEETHAQTNRITLNKASFELFRFLDLWICGKFAVNWSLCSQEFHPFYIEVIMETLWYIVTTFEQPLERLFSVRCPAKAAVGGSLQPEYHIPPNHASAAVVSSTSTSTFPLHRSQGYFRRPPLSKGRLYEKNPLAPLPHHSPASNGNKFLGWTDQSSYKSARQNFVFRRGALWKTF